MHGLTPRLHGSPACLPGPSLLYCDHGPRSPSSLSAAVTSGTGRAALFFPQMPLFQGFRPVAGTICPSSAAAVVGPPRASQGMKKGRRPRRRPRLKLSDRAGPDQCPVPGENALFPAQIAGFLAASRPVPVYPVFLNYVVPVHPASTRRPAAPPRPASGAGPPPPGPLSGCHTGSPSALRRPPGTRGPGQWRYMSHIDLQN